MSTDIVYATVHKVWSRDGPLDNTEEQHACDVEYAAVTFRRNELQNQKRHPKGCSRWIAVALFLVVICVGVGLCILYIGSSEEQCSVDWDSFGAKCYYFFHDALNWTTSRAKCVSMGGHLVIIDSRGEQMYIIQKLNATEEFWIGLTDSETEGEWKWADNSDLKNITFWHRGQPNNSSGINSTHVDGEDCALMRYVEETELNWFDEYCGRSKKSICEAKAT